MGLLVSVGIEEDRKLKPTIIIIIIKKKTTVKDHLRFTSMKDFSLFLRKN